MKSFFHAPQVLKNKKDELTRQGRSEYGSQVEGLRIVAPLDATGDYLPPATLVTHEYGQHFVYDGRMRIIDSETFKKKVEVAKRRKREIENQIEMLLDGGDTVAAQYMGPYFDMLHMDNLNNNKKEIAGYMTLDGFNEDQVKSYFDNLGIGGIEIDARPSSITFSNETSAEYTKKIQKLALVLRYANLIFTGSTISENPEIGKASKEKLFTGFNPSNNALRDTYGNKAQIGNDTSTEILKAKGIPT